MGAIPILPLPSPSLLFLPTTRRPSIIAAAVAPSTTGTSSLSSSSSRRDKHADRSVDMPGLLGALSLASTPAELAAVMSPYLDATKRPGARRRRLSLRFMVGLLAREPDWRRSLALLDWMLEVAGYPPSVFAYNVVLRNALRAAEYAVAAGLFDEMRDRHGLSPDRCSYATVISALGKAGQLDAALSWLHRMEGSGVRPDLVLYSTLIELARRLGDYSRAAALFSRLRSAGIEPDAVACNSMLAVYAKAGLLREARALLAEMGEAADDASFSILLSAYAEKGRFVEALSLFSELRAAGKGPDLAACNIMIDVYGKAGMAREADRLFWSMRRIGVPPNVVSYNTMLRVYGDAELIGEAVHLFRLMQKKGVEQNAITYNTMIAIYGRTLEHEKAGNLLREMQGRGIAPNAVTYSTIISIWARAGKLARATALFEKLQQSSGAGEMDPVLYQTMIAAYEQAGLVAHAKRLLAELNGDGSNGGVSGETAVVILAGAGRVEEAARVFRRIPQVKDVGVFRCMMELFAGSRRHRAVVEVLEKMLAAGFLPDAGMVGTAMHALGKLQMVDQAEALYREMQTEGCALPDRVHFQMLGLHGARGDFAKVEALLAELEADPNVDKRELRLVAASVYEKGNRLDEASRIIAGG